MPTSPASSSVPVNRRRRLLGLGLGTVGAAAVAGGGWFAWSRWGGGAPKESPYILASVQRGDIEDLVSATGALQPRDYVDVGAQVSGQLRRIHVQVGSEVLEGDLLAEIDAETSAARVEANRASVKSQQATLAQRESDLDKAERDLKRLRNLLAEDATTLEEVQNAESTVRTVRAQIDAIHAQIEQTRASMRVEEANLKYTRIYAPMSGTVVSVAARQGQTLNANQSAPNLLRIADLSTMTVQTQVSEADVAKLRADMPVYFTTLGGQGRRWWGTLRKVEPTPTVTNNVVLYNALFDVPNPQRNLMTQMTAQVFFVAAKVEDVLMVPMSALALQRSAGRRDAAGRGGSASAVESPETPASSASAASSERRERTAGALPSDRRARPEKSDPAASASPDRPRSTAPADRPTAERRHDRPTTDTPGAGPASAPRTGGDRPDWGSMSEEERTRRREERRRELESLPPEEREKRLAERRARMASGGGNGPGGATPGSNGSERRGERAGEARSDSSRRSAEASSDETARPSRDGARRSDARAQSPTPYDAAQGATRPVNRGIWAGPAGSSRAQGPRKAKVKVVNEAGEVSEREVTIGVSNRVHAQILSGLQEGEKVIAGERQAESNRDRAGNSGNAQDRNRNGGNAGNGLGSMGAGVPGTGGGVPGMGGPGGR